MVLLIVAAVHAYVFLYGWHFVGRHPEFAALGYMHYFLLSKVIGAVVASVVTTLPLAFLAGYVCRARLLVPACILFPLGWVAFRCAFGGMPQHYANIATLLVEVLGILVVSAVAFWLGAQAQSRFGTKVKHGAAV
jgi:hypothetical protein